MNSSTQPAPRLSNASAQKINVCPYCPYSSEKISNVKVHIRTHSGEKPYACSFCPYSAAQKKSVLIHERRHTGEKPYECPFCPFNTSQNICMKKHIQGSHGCQAPSSML